MSFQYISCYCLSSVIQVDRFHASSFQYISCYCLSYLRHVYSHLSLNFNTSHVTVYRYHSTSFFFATFISIHLMLLFIEEQEKVEITYTIFQYISCYCLSILHVHIVLQFPYFNTSHVTVYRQRNLQRFYNVGFQYISCYCLSHTKGKRRKINSISIHLMLLFI